MGEYTQNSLLTATGLDQAHNSVEERNQIMATLLLLL